MHGTIRTHHKAIAPVPLVLLPGTLCDERVFSPLRALLPPDRAVHVEPTAGAPSADALAGQLLDRREGGFALLGFSLGAIVALAVAARAPDRVAGLALLAGTARPVPPRRQEERRAAAAAAPFPPPPGAWDEQIGHLRRSDPALRATIAAMAAGCDRASCAEQLEIALTRADSRPRLPSLTMPALVLGGDEDRTNPPELQREMASLLPDAELVLVSGTGHFLPLEAPGACAAAVRRWLDRVDARALGRPNITAQEDK